jgi:hypothetical protein
MEDATIVRLERGAIEPGHFDGRVVAISGELFALSVVGSGARLNGFSVLRCRDVTSVRAPGPFAQFLERALRARGERSATISFTSLLSWSEAISVAQAYFPLVTIHTEAVKPDVCFIGRVVSMATDSVALRTIGPDASWSKKEKKFKLSDITRVDCGGAYEEALALVAAEEG